MLRNLHIQNYALIEKLDIDFSSGFSVITGETGAGKSIILGALSILLGGRADNSVISTGAKRCVVEATFTLHSPEATHFLKNNDLDVDDEECIVRRELTDAGKSRAFVNDTPVSVATLKELSNLIIDIHSQHQSLLLNNAQFQLDVLDSVANDETLLSEYKSAYTLYKRTQTEYDAFIRKTEEDSANIDFLQFQFNELSAAKLAEGEQEDLEAELRILENAESIKQAVYESQQQLADISEKMHSTVRTLERIVGVFTPATAFAERIDSSRIEIDDIESSLASYDTSFDPERLDYVNERLTTIYSLQKKFHKATVSELLQMQQELASQLGNITNNEEAASQLRRKCELAREESKAAAQKLSAVRQKSAARIEKEIASRLKPLGMPNVTFVIDIQHTEDLLPNGQERVQFLFSANKNIPPRPLEKIASGGEIARVMLSLKAMLSAHRHLPTIIFDEIDSGVSGKIADEMASVMNDICHNERQVICITHNPQIAARGTQHYRVFKENQRGTAHTHIELLSTEQRVQEIAQMLSASSVSEAAISNAKTLLQL